MSFIGRLGIRCKLVIIFVLIKVLPLIALAWVAWNGITLLGLTVEEKIAELSTETEDVIGDVGDIAVKNSIRALDDKSRENIERLTTDTARAVASFLYSRDNDIRLAAGLTPSEKNYAKFLSPRKRAVTLHRPWKMNETGDKWIPVEPPSEVGVTVVASNADNAKDFHYRQPEDQGVQVESPLFLEMTFIDLDGNERVKVTTSDLLPMDKRDVSIQANTFCKAETYFPELKKLRPGEIYVSDVIGAHVKSPLIGAYTEKRAREQGIPFEPEEAAYAGKENPVGKRFRGIIRWATPVVRDGKMIGYVTLALDHTHVMEFTDHLVPTEERYSPISDAGSGNYAFMWDYKDRNISHPRDYFIVGYDPKTGLPATPWLEDGMYEAFKASGLRIDEWQSQAPVMQEQSLRKKPASDLTREGMLGLDCRYLNFAPQCEGWYNLTKDGGSGSFVIFWSGLWKLTTAAAIPYSTGHYGATPRGFGFVTIGANVHEFHRAATLTGARISDMAEEFKRQIALQKRQTQETLRNILTTTTKRISYSTLIMVLIVVGIAFWMASTLTKKITSMIHGIRIFQGGDMEHRLAVESEDEMGHLAETFNGMSDDIQQLIHDLKLAEKNYRGFFENATEGIFRTTAAGRLVDVNPAYAHLFGFDSPSAMIEQVEDIGQLYVDPERRIELVHLLEEYGSIRDFEYEVKLPDGAKRVLLASCYYVKDRDGESYLEGVSTDISERRLKEKAEIERESAVASNLAKSIFLANMSHEIRTPMNALLGMASLLSETSLDEQQRQYVSLFQSAGESLLSLLNQILDFSKIEAGQMALDKMPMDLRESVLMVESIMAVQASERGLHLHCRMSNDIPDGVIGDSLRLNQVLMNLVGNAVKFTNHGSVTLHVDVVDETATTVLIRFKVSDTGVGIPNGKLSTVFEGFTQADSSTTKKHGGTGLGLTIARELVHLMGGELSVQSITGVGTTFRFEVLFERFAGEAGDVPQLTPEKTVLESGPKRILLVEDSDSNRILIGQYIKNTFHELIMVENGQKAVEYYQNDSGLDIILMDVLMPVMDGLDATRLIREYEKENDLSPVPIIALTANAFEEDRQNCLKAGCTDYLSKPVRKADLLSRIDSAVRPTDRRG